MNKNNIIYIVGGVLLGILLVLLIAPQSDSVRFGMMGRNNNGEGTQMMRNIDKHFIEQMIPHHEGAIEMAELALERGTHPEIKTLAQAIITAQKKENTDMKSWYKSWFGTDVPQDTNMMMGNMMSGRGMHMGSNEDIGDLQTAADFDKEFIEQMIPHHQMAIMMAQMLESGTNRPEMEQLAKNIIDSQSEEIEMMQGWYDAWYK